MAIFGTGVVPASGAITNELTATTRRAFVPKLIVQIYFGSPTLWYMMGNAQRAAGGLSQVTVPLQGQSMVQGAFTGYGGGFASPNITPAIQPGQWNLAYWTVPIPLPFGEQVIQASERVIPILKARMVDAYSVTRQQLATLFFTNNSTNPLAPDSFLSAYDNGTNFPTYGGINRNAAGNSFFKGQYINLAASPWTTAFASGATRKAMQALIMYVTQQAGGEAPTFIVMNPGDYATLNNDFVGVEQINPAPGSEYSMDTAVRSSFPNINISGVKIYADYFCPKGSFFMINTKYTAMYIDEDVNFEFSGFYSLVPLNQMAQQGVVVLGYDVLSVKPVSGAWCYGLPGASF